MVPYLSRRGSTDGRKGQGFSLRYSADRDTTPIFIIVHIEDKYGENDDEETFAVASIGDREIWRQQGYYPHYDNRGIDNAIDDFAIKLAEVLK
jgi:hypothetical protein